MSVCFFHPQKLKSGEKIKYLLFVNCKRHTVMLTDYETKGSTTGNTSLRHH